MLEGSSLTAWFAAILLRAPALLVALALLAACGLEPTTEAPVGPSVPTGPPPAGFEAYRDPAGFTLQKPAGWQVTSRGITEVAIVSPDGVAAALIRARLVRGDLTQWLAQSYLGTETGVQRFEPISAEPSGPNASRALLRYTDPANTEKRASVVAVRQGEVATVFTALGPAVDFATTLPVLTQILDSFRFAPATPSNIPAAPQTAYVQWVDPFERAWAMEVPAGWQSEGGLIRRDGGVRAAWQLTAPGGSALFFGGDTSVPRYFVLPNATSLSLGFREGEPTGPNGPIMLRFQEAASMGPDIFQRRFGAAQVVSTRERPDLVEYLQRNPLLQGAIPKISAVELEFRLADGRVGMMALTTYGQEVGTLGGTWMVDNIHGFVAPPDRMGEVGAALARAIGTSRENPVWRQGESQLQAQLAAQWADYLAFSNNIQRQTIEARWASDSAIQRQRRDILGGTVRLVDPQTGEGFEASGQNRYYFRLAGQPGVVGTDTDFNPAPDFDLRRLLQVGVDIKDR